MSGIPPIPLSTQSPIYSTIVSLMATINKPTQAVQAKVTNLQSLNTVYGNVKNNLSALVSAAAAMNDPVAQPLAARTVSSGGASIVTASAAPGAALGSHSVSVSQLARQHTLVSNQYGAAGADIVNAEAAGDKSFTVTVNGHSEDVTVTLTAGESNSDVISAVAAAINAAFAGVDGAHAVTASALADTSTTSKLVLTSDQTGATHKITLADDQNGGTLLAALGISNESAATGTTGGYIYVDSALDAQMTVDGVGVTRDSNTVSDVLPGVTLNLNGHQAAGADPVDLVIGANSSAITSSIQNLIAAYNSALSYLSAQTTINAATGAGSALSGESAYRNLIGTLRAAVGASIPGTGADQVRTLADVGITQATDGTLSISNSQALNQALTSCPAAVAGLFNATGGIASQLNAALTPFTRTHGFLDAEVDNANARISTLNVTIDRMNSAAALRQQQLVNEYAQLQALQSTLSSQQSFMQAVLAQLASTSSGG